MFGSKREMIDKLNTIEEYSKKLEAYGDTCNTGMKALVTMVKSLLTENKELTENIKTLIELNQGNLGEAPNCEALLIKSYRNAPIVYKDGKLLTNDKMKNIYVRWSVDDPIEVEIDT